MENPPADFDTDAVRAASLSALYTWMCIQKKSLAFICGFSMKSEKSNPQYSRSANNMFLLLKVFFFKEKP